MLLNLFKSFLLKFTSSKLFLFSCVGGVVFLIDGLICQLLFLKLSVKPNYARIYSILIAMNFSWILNRKFTFKVTYNRSLLEWFLFISILVTGALINYVVFLLGINLLGEHSISIWTSLAIGSASGFFFNFSMANIFYKRTSKSIKNKIT
jgi:putative flippase GtrA